MYSIIIIIKQYVLMISKDIYFYLLNYESDIFNKHTNIVNIYFL